MSRERSFSVATMIGLVFLVPIACGSNREGGGVASVPGCSDDSGGGDGSSDPDGGDGSNDLDGGDGSTCDGAACPSPCEVAAASKGSNGCGFWTLPPDDSQFGKGSCFAAAIVNAGNSPVTLQADWGGNPLDLSNSVYTVSLVSGQPVYTKVQGSLPPGQHALVFLAQGPESIGQDFTACPSGVTPAVAVDPIQHGTTRTRAFHIGTSAPVAAYSIFPYGGAATYFPSATLLLPESAFGIAYIGATVGMFGDPSTAYGLSRTMQIVATEDNTEVSIGPNPSAGDDAAAPGPVSVLGRGEVLQLTEEGLTSGSPIRASKPVGLFGGAPCAFIPGDTLACDLFQQQIAPLSQWGTEYALVPYPSRSAAPETVPWTFVGAASGTVLTWTPAKPPGAPDHLEAGQVVNFMSDAIASVKSQDSAHPFHAAVYMTGGLTTGAAGAGDPDFVVVPPTEQFLDRYAIYVDYMFRDSSLTLVRKKSGGSFKPVQLECAGEISGWQPVGPTSEYEYAWVRLTSNFEPQPFPNGTCGYGRHVLQSEGPFSVHVWGTSPYASYGFAGGMGTRTVNGVALPASSSPASSSPASPALD